jgi:tetratricopeptide (TPR) repeat protein
MKLRFLVSALIKFSFLISTLAITTSAAAAQEDRNSLRLTSLYNGDVNQTHVSVGELNRTNNGLSNNIVIYGAILNQQDVNRIHIPIGEINSATSLTQVEIGVTVFGNGSIVGVNPIIPVSYLRSKNDVESAVATGNSASSSIRVSTINDLLGDVESGIGGSIKIETYEKRFQLNPDSAKAYFELGLAYAESGRNEEAAQAYKQAISIQPDFVKAQFALGLINIELGRNDDAIEAFKQVIRISPDDSLARVVLGFVYTKSGRNEEAAEAYKQAISIEPDFAEAHFFLGLTYLYLGEKGSALDEYVILKSIDQNLASKLFNKIHR